MYLKGLRLWGCADSLREQLTYRTTTLSDITTYRRDIGENYPALSFSTAIPKVVRQSIGSNMNNISSNSSHLFNQSADSEESQPFGNVVNIFVAWNVLEKLVTVLSNGMTLIILCNYARLETPSNVFIAGLTLSDLFSAAALPFTIASVYLPAGLWWNISCIVHICIATATSFLNTTLLLVIAIDRLVYMVYSLTYHLLVTVRRAIAVVCFLWIVGTLFSVSVTLLGYESAYLEGTLSGSCIPYYALNLKARLLTGTPYFVCIPFTILCYVKIGLIARRQRMAIAAAQPGNGPPANNPTAPDHKIAKVMLNVLVIYVLSNSMVLLQPLVIRFLVGSQRELLFRIMIIIKRISTWVNPVVYVWKSKRFRQHVKNFVRNHHSTGNSVF